MQTSAGLMPVAGWEEHKSRQPPWPPLLSGAPGGWPCGEFRLKMQPSSALTLSQKEA